MTNCYFGTTTIATCYSQVMVDGFFLLFQRLMSVPEIIHVKTVIVQILRDPTLVLVIVDTLEPIVMKVSEELLLCRKYTI